ncbi:hypothetical protein D3C73_822270 [compost metagenome]
MVGFVLGLQALQDFVGLAHGRLDDVDLLEATSQRPVLLEDAAVFLEGSRADAAQLARRQCRLDQVGGIHGAARRRTRADDGVDLVDEQHRIGHLLQRGQHTLQTLFEVATVFGASHQRAQVERIDDRIGQHVRHRAFHDASGQAFGNRGLADAGLAHVQRVVLAAAAQDLDGAFDFVGTADQRVDATGAGLFVEVAGELGQGIALGLALAPFHAALALGRGRLLAFLTQLGDAVGQIIDHIQPGDVLLVEVIDGVGVLFAEDGDQHVGAGDLLLAGGLHVVHGPLQHALETQGRLGIAAVIFGQAGHGGLDGLLQLLAQAVGIGTTGLQYGLGGRVVEQCQQQVFDRHELMSGLTGALVALADGVFEVFAEHGLLRRQLGTICGLTTRFPSP